MIHAYHVIFGTYGFWLPNDPRGSWSDYVGKFELVHFGKANRSLDRKDIAELSAEEQNRLEEAKRYLNYPAVHWNDHQIDAVASGFEVCLKKSNLTIWACSILPEHVHLVIARHKFDVEKIANLLKGEATKQLNRLQLHPLAVYAKAGKRPPSPWAENQWKVFLDTEESIDNAIRYVEENPIREGRSRQQWSFVSPFRGLDVGWVTYH
jgi:REP element-mobilizing transposase RayT